MASKALTGWHYGVMEWQRLWAWLKAIRYWWIAAIGFLPSAADLAGSEWADNNIDSPLSFALISLALLLFGSYWAFRKITLDNENLKERLAEQTPKFKITVPDLPVGRPDAYVVPDVYLVNRNQRRTANLRFFLEVDGERVRGKTLGTTITGQTQLPNPKHLDKGGNYGDHYMAFERSTVDDTPFVVDGVRLIVVDEQTHGFELAIPLPTSADGFSYPEDVEG